MKNYKIIVLILGYVHWNVANYYLMIRSFKRCILLNIDSYDLQRRAKQQFCVQVFVVDIELQELTHAGDKPCVLYCDMTETELQKCL